MRRPEAVAGGRPSAVSGRAAAALGVEGFGLSRTGLSRQGNEDSMLVGGGSNGGLFAVADGMGGHAAGEVASRAAVEALEHLPASVALDAAVRGANVRIFAVQDEGLEHGDPSGMGTTVVALRFSRAGIGFAVEVAHVGDSRAYLFRDGLLLPLTEAHSFVNSLVAGGVIGREETSRHPRRNILNRALGTSDPRPDLAFFEALPGDRVLLCSDGLHGVVPEREIAELLLARGGSREAARALVRAAFDARGPDDVTAVVADVAGLGGAGHRRTLRRKERRWPEDWAAGSRGS